VEVNLEQAIHEHWADCSELQSLLPADRLTTGRTRSGTLPYATLESRAIRPQLPTNQGSAVCEVAFRIHVWHGLYDDARAIAEQVRAALGGASLKLNEPELVTRVRHAGDSIRQHADGVWQWSVDFVACVSVVL